MYLKILNDENFNFSSTCKCEISINLLSNSAIIIKILNCLSRSGGQDWVVGNGNALAPLATALLCLEKEFGTF